MQLPADRRTLFLLIGAAVAVLAGVIIAFALLRGGDSESDAPPASQGGLIIDSSGVEDGNLDPARPLKCFVAGQVVGELTLAECAQRNGVSSGSLDVGLDNTGALAATGDAGAILTPLPPGGEPGALAETSPAPQMPSVSAVPAGSCWRFEGRWTQLPGDLSLSGCVQTLFDGRCETRGRPIYGRWMQQTLRLMSGKIDISGDNRSFRPLVDQDDGCGVPAL